MLVSKVPVFLQTLVDDFFEFVRQIGIESNWRNRNAVQDRLENDPCGFTTERQHPRAHLVENGAEGKQVCASIELLPSNLFRRHVRDRSQRTAGTRQMFLGLDGCGIQGNALRLESDL